MIYMLYVDLRQKAGCKVIEGFSRSINVYAGGENPGSANACVSMVRASGDGDVWSLMLPEYRAHVGGVRHEYVHGCVSSVDGYARAHDARSGVARYPTPSGFRQ